MIRAISLILFLSSLLVCLVSAFFLGNSYDTIGYSNQNKIGGIIGLILAGILFVMGALNLARTHRTVLANHPIEPMYSQPQSSQLVSPVIEQQQSIPMEPIEQQYSSQRPLHNPQSLEQQRTLNNSTIPAMMHSY